MQKGIYVCGEILNEPINNVKVGVKARGGIGHASGPVPGVSQIGYNAI